MWQFGKKGHRFGRANAIRWVKLSDSLMLPSCLFGASATSGITRVAIWDELWWDDQVLKYVFSKPAWFREHTHSVTSSLACKFTWSQRHWKSVESIGTASKMPKPFLKFGRFAIPSCTTCSKFRLLSRPQAELQGINVISQEVTNVFGQWASLFIKLHNNQIAPSYMSFKIDAHFKKHIYIIYI